MPTFGMLIASLLLVFALWWVKEMFDSWRSDLEELLDPQTQWVPRLCLIGLWLVTFMIAFFAIGFIVRMAIMLFSGIHSIFYS